MCSYPIGGKFVSIRLAGIDDLDALARMNVELRADERIDNVITTDQVKERMRGFLVGKSYGVHVFIVDVTRSPAYMRQLFIVRDSRRRGLERKFFQLLVRALGADAIDVELFAWN
jgi:hypothetical protein